MSSSETTQQLSSPDEPSDRQDAQHQDNGNDSQCEDYYFNQKVSIPESESYVS